MTKPAGHTPVKTPVKTPAATPTATPAATMAMAWMHTAKFLTTAPKLEFLPPLSVPESGFV